MTSIAIVGGGPAGYVAAITAAQLGQEVILIEEKSMGGTCLNEGCIPTKSLLKSADVCTLVKEAKVFGIELHEQTIRVNWDTVQTRKNEVVSQLVGGIQYLMKRNRVKVINGRATFISSNQLEVITDSKREEFTVDKVIIATGSEPASLPFAPFEGRWIINSSQALSLPEVPSSLVIIGGGVIGCEFASVFSRLGSKVTIIEMADQILPGEDNDIVNVLQQQLEEDGVAVICSAKVIDLNSTNKSILFESLEGDHEIKADYVLVSIGRVPRVDHLGLEKVGINFSKNGIAVDNRMQTNIPSIYACGDVIGGTQLAHVAFHEGHVAAANTCGQSVEVNYKAVPRCIYTSPEIASIGLSEEQAREEYGDIRIGEFPFAANGKAIISNEPTGKVKVMVDPQFGEILGMTIVGPHATELIGQGSIMIHTEMTIDLLDDLIAAHPTLSEAIQEALLSSIGHAVHV